MNIRNHPNWTRHHEARLQTLFALESLLNELRETDPNQLEIKAADPFDLIAGRRSAEQVMSSLMRVTPLEESQATANAMFERH